MPPEDSPELFPVASASAPDPGAPLAERMRPRSLDEIVGQPHLVGPGGPLRALAEAGALPSLLLWGPPGCGKTTVARLLATGAGLHREALSAVGVGVREIRAAIERARRERGAGRGTALLLDEIHRLNRAQQDALLPHLEEGVVTLIGATTENPSFEINAPLLSRCRVYTLERLDEASLATLVRRAADDPERGLGGLALADDVPAAIAHAADGDARRALGLLEAAAALPRSPRDGPLPLDAVREAAGRSLLVHDRDREEHYNVVSAFIKSLRASDPDAALYWGARLLEAGEDPRFLCRRMTIFAAEDVGNADPQALPLALATWQAVERIGLPEGRIPIGQAIAYLACAPRSNAAYRAIDAARAAVREHGSLPVPLHLRNAPTGLMRRLGYGAGAADPHAAEDRFVPSRNLPDALGSPGFYQPTAEGAEAAVAERLRGWRARRRAALEKQGPRGD